MTRSWMDCVSTSTRAERTAAGASGASMRSGAAGRRPGVRLHHAHEAFQRGSVGRHDVDVGAGLQLGEGHQGVRRGHDVNVEERPLRLQHGGDLLVVERRRQEDVVGAAVVELARDLVDEQRVHAAAQQRRQPERQLLDVLPAALHHPDARLGAEERLIGALGHELVPRLARQAEVAGLLGQGSEGGRQLVDRPHPVLRAGHADHERAAAVDGAHDAVVSQLPVDAADGVRVDAELVGRGSRAGQPVADRVVARPDAVDDHLLQTCALARHLHSPPLIRFPTRLPNRARRILRPLPPGRRCEGSEGSVGTGSSPPGWPRVRRPRSAA